jgi:predicted helicase
MFPKKFDKENKMIGVMGDATEKPFSTLASSIISDMNILTAELEQNSSAVSLHGERGAGGEHYGLGVGAISGAV